MTCGIYSITHVSSGRSYIGSARNIERRWRAHKTRLKHNKHHSQYLQNAWNKYGQDAFSWMVIEQCDELVLMQREQHYLNHRPAFNVALFAGAPMLGRRQAVSLRAR